MLPCPVPLFLLLAGLLVAAPPAAAGAEPTAPGRPDLSGHWTLDAKRSDSPDARMREGGPGGRRPGAGRGGGRPGGGPGGHPGAGREAMGGQMEAMRTAAATLELQREGEGYLLVDGRGRAWKLPADGNERETAGLEGGSLWVRSEWDLEGRLVVRRVQSGRPTVTETYSLDPADGSLVVTTRLAGGPRGSFERRRVYIRSSPPPARLPPAGDEAAPARPQGRE